MWRYAEYNRLLVGSGQIPLNIELKQDDRTVCCSHTVVDSVTELISYEAVCRTAPATPGLLNTSQASTTKLAGSTPLSLNKGIMSNM